MALATCSDCGTQVSKAANSCPKCGRNFKGTPVSGCLVAFVLVLGGCFFFYYIGSSGNPPPSPQAATYTPSAPRDDRTQSQMYAQQFVKITNDEWKRGGFDTVLLADFRIKNLGQRDVSDVKVQCVTSGESSETVINKPSTTIFETIRAGKSRSFHEVNMGWIPQQVKRAGCHVEDVTLR